MKKEKNNNSNMSAEDRKMLNSIFWRSFTVFAGNAGATKAGADGFLYSIMPAIKRYYKDDPDGKKDAMFRHTTWYNITQNVGTFAMGLVAAMEKENAEKENFDDTSIAAIKTSLMGPMSGIGDSIFWGVIRVIAAGVGINMSANGSVLGPIMFLLIYNIPSIICRYYMTYAGFNLGSTFIEKIFNSGGMRILTKCASIMGLIMVGAMTASNVQFESIIEIPVKNADPVKVQTYLDQLFVGIVPLLLTLGCLTLLNKKVNVNLVMLLVLVLAVLLAVLGVV